MKPYPTLRVALCAIGLFAGCISAPQLAMQSIPKPTPIAVVPPVPTYRGPIVDLTGDGAAIGAVHGKQLATPIQFLHDHYLKVYLGTGTQRFLALGAAKLFETYFRPEHRAEIGALATQSGMDEREAVLAQCFLDLSPMSACSTITLPASAAPDHIARFGRNLDFLSLHV